ncbi:MAG: MFS transporter [Propionibacteriaceae bacterium]
MSTQSTTQTDKPQTRLVLMIVMLAFLGQMMLTPVIAPLSRAMGLREWQIGATISLAAVALVLLSQFWGRRSQKIGVKKVLLLSMFIALCALIGFAAVAWLGTKALLTGPVLFLGTLGTRGLIYGGAIAAISPTAQSHLITHSNTEAERVKAVGAIGAVQGMSAILGSIFGGALAAIGGLLLPVMLMPLMMIMGIVLLAFRFHPQDSGTLIEQPRRVSFKDSRVLPFLIAGFILFLSFSSIQSVLGFAVQDRLKLSDSATAGTTALLMAVMAVAMALAQGVLVRRLGWNARKLLRAGFPLMALGAAVLIPAGSVVILAVGCLLIGVGSGLAIPGYSAGPTLAMDHDEQGGLAGLINANNGLTYVLAPVLSTTLYGLHHAAPFFVIAGMIALGCVFVYVHPAIKHN